MPPMHRDRLRAHVSQTRVFATLASQRDTSRSGVFALKVIKIVTDDIPVGGSPVMIPACITSRSTLRPIRALRNSGFPGQRLLLLR